MRRAGEELSCHAEMNQELLPIVQPGEQVFSPSFELEHLAANQPDAYPLWGRYEEIAGRAGHHLADTTANQ